MTAFLKSGIGWRMRKASLENKLYRERPFTMSFKADMLNKNWSDCEDVLVQGIIDAYFIEDGEIVLVDYKTDHVSDEEELINRYHRQLLIYSEVLSKSIEKKVKEIMIYSTELQNCVKITENKR